MTEPGRRAAIFDLDGTLIGLPSSERRFIGELWARRRIDWRRASLFAVFLLVWLPRFGTDVARRNKAYLSGLPVREVESLGERFADQLTGEVRPALLARLREHQRRGDFTLLLSGSPYFIAEPLGAALGFEAVIATRPATTGDAFSWLPPVCHPLGAAKARLAALACRVRDLDLAAAAAYGDSALDLPLLLRVADPVAVAPDRTLWRAARARRWPVLEH
jgi:HAD superfamily phosphoserine phosphatase-like hydrolase